jgi:hypothetical protein
MVYQLEMLKQVQHDVCVVMARMELLWIIIKK